MIPLNTPVRPHPLKEPLSHNDHILSFGSCFSEHLSNKLKTHHFDLCANPTGILYNPAAIQRVIKRLTKDEPFHENDLIQHEGLWHSFLHHGSFSNPDKTKALATMNTHREAAKKQLTGLTHLFITFGTAFAWFLKEQPDFAVANCHKLPPENFERHMIPAHDIARNTAKIMRQLKAKNPQLQVTLTVSPVRYLRQNAPENSLSKAQLVTACHLLCAELNYMHYFPAYEIMLDELRDYRFYAEDLVHPNKLAQQIIWERFSTHCIAGKSQQFMAEHAQLLRMRNHRPLHPGTQNATRFQATLQARQHALNQKYPDIMQIADQSDKPPED